MDIGIVREWRSREHRVALTPSGAKALVQSGHRVFVETGAGAGAGHSDADYASAGAEVVFSRAEAFGRGDLLVGVFPPEPREFQMLRPEQVMFAFWAMPTMRPEDFSSLAERRITAVGLELIEDAHGHAPVLTCMSEIAGPLAVTIGSALLLNDYGGKGILLGGAPGVPPGNLVILGAGVLGLAAARTAQGLGAHVTLLDHSLDKLRQATHLLSPPLATMLATRPNLEKALGYADLVLGAAAVRGERAPQLVTRAMLALMRPRSVVMDLAIDMGGCFESARPTSFPEPTYEAEGILHFCVPNLPSMAARSATLSLTSVLLPYLLQVAESGFEAAADATSELQRGTYLYRGICCKDALGRLFRVPTEPLSLLLEDACRA